MSVLGTGYPLVKGIAVLIVCRVLQWCEAQVWSQGSRSFDPGISEQGDSYRDA